jgi:hypothetical protein
LVQTFCKEIKNGGTVFGVRAKQNFFGAQSIQVPPLDAGQ